MRMIRLGLLVVAVFAAIWLLAIVVWRLTGITPGGVQMVLVLAVLPVAVLGAVFMVRRARRRRAEAGAAADDVPAAETDDEENRPEGPRLALLAASLRLPVGRDPAGVLAALREARPPGLHPKLRDRDGLPAFAAWVEDLDTDPVEGALAQAKPGVKADPAQQRALALLEATAEELFSETVSLLPAATREAGRVVAGMHHHGAVGETRRLQLHVLLPAAWPAALREATAAMLGLQARDCGLSLQAAAVPVAGAHDAWQTIARIADEADGGRWQLLLAADSWIGEQAVRRLEAAGQLMTARREDGRLPGEGAAGVLLAALPEPAAPALAVLHAVRRGEASLASLRAAARQTADLLAGALQRADIAPDAVGQVLSDADHRAAQAVEATTAVSAVCAELDTSGQCQALGRGNGSLDAVAPVALLALGGARVAAAGQPLVLLSVTDERNRFAMAVAPPAPAEPSSEPAGADAPVPAA